MRCFYAENISGTVLQSDLVSNISLLIAFLVDYHADSLEKLSSFTKRFRCSHEVLLAKTLVILI